MCASALDNFLNLEGEMIEVTRLNNSKFWVNAEFIEVVEATPDTIISLTNGHKFVVKEPPEAVVGAIVAYRRRIFHPAEQIIKRDE